MGAYIHLPQECSQGAQSSYSIELLMKLQCQIFEAPYLHSWDRHMRPLSFCRKLNFEKLPFQYDIIFHHINFSSQLAPLWRELDICAHRLFCVKFNSEQLLLEAFLCDAYFWQRWALNFVSNPYKHIINQLKSHSVTSCIMACVSIEQTLLYNDIGYPVLSTIILLLASPLSSYY